MWPGRVKIPAKLLVIQRDGIVCRKPWGGMVSSLVKEMPQTDYQWDEIKVKRLAI